VSSVAASGLVGHRSPAARCKQLLLGPPLATSRLVTERLRKVVALAVFSSDAISSTAYARLEIVRGEERTAVDQGCICGWGRPRRWRCCVP
jgi:hypothetical protein